MTASAGGEHRRILGNHPFFAHLAPAELDRLLVYARVARYRANQVIVSKGEEGSGMMAVLKGSVRIRVPSHDGRELVLNTVEPGGVFGEIALLDGKERTADAVAAEDCELLVLERRDVLPFLERHPEALMRLIGILCERLRRTTEQVEDVLFLDVPARLAKKLLELADRHGQATPRGVRVVTRLSQRQLGNLLGMSRESINKQLRAWHEEGTIELEEGSITLRDPAALRDIALVYE